MEQQPTKRSNDHVAGCSKKRKKNSGLIRELKKIRSGEMTEIFSVCLESKNISEIQSLVKKFWDIFEVNLMSNERNCGVYRIAFMCPLEYIYKTEETDILAISRVMFGYLRHAPPGTGNMRYIMELPGYKNLPLLESLRSCTLYTQWKPEIVTEMIYQIAWDGRYGFLQFLVKYTKCSFLPQNSETLTVLTDTIIHWIKCKEVIVIEKSHEEKMQLCFQNLRSLTSGMESEKDVLFARIKHFDRKFRYRRFIFTLFLMTMVISYRQPRNVLHCVHGKELYLHKSKCLNLMIEVSTEPYISHRDIEEFFDVFFDPPYSGMLSEAMRDYAKELSPDMEQDPSPRKLEDLSRCKLRECLQDQTTLPEQVSSLPLPPPLKKLILFNNHEIGETLMNDHKLVLKLMR